MQDKPKIVLVLIDEMASPVPEVSWDMCFDSIEKRALAITPEEFKKEYFGEFNLECPSSLEPPEESKPKKPFPPIPPWDRRYRRK